MSVVQNRRRLSCRKTMQMAAQLGGHHRQKCKVLELRLKGPQKAGLPCERRWIKTQGRNQGFGGRIGIFFKCNTCYTNFKTITTGDSDQAQGERNVECRYIHNIYDGITRRW